MRFNYLAGAGALAGVTIGLLGWLAPNSRGQAPGAATAIAWEYRTWWTQNINATDDLNRQASQGWDVVGVTSMYLPVNNGPQYLYVLKRPKR